MLCYAGWWVTGLVFLFAERRDATGVGDPEPPERQVPRGEDVRVAAEPAEPCERKKGGGETDRGRIHDPGRERPEPRAKDRGRDRGPIDRHGHAEEPAVAEDASTVFGDAGRDTIMADIERAGHRLSGGSGGDSFVFHSADATGRSQSVITDFTAGQDRILWVSRVIDLDHLPKGMALHDSAAGLVLEFSPGNSVLLEGFFL